MRYLLCLVLLTLFPRTESRAATVPGAAVFVRVTGTAGDARSDVYEQRLAGGPARVLVSHAALPKSFRARIARALPSPDGAAVLLVEGDGMVIRNQHTGATRLEFNGTYAPGKGEVDIEDFGGGYWLWSRGTGAVKRIVLADSGEDVITVDWSPRGKLLLALVFGRRTHALRIFDAETGRRHSLLTTGEGLACARWKSDGTGVLVGDGAKVELVSLTGRTQCLFTRQASPSLLEAAISPDGRTVAVGDTEGFSLVNRHGGARRNVALPATADWPGDDQDSLAARPWGEATFSRDGSTLAVFAASASGPAHTTIHEELWVVQIGTIAAKRLALWGVFYSDQHADDDLHELLGWVPGQPALFVVSQPSNSEGPGSDWRKLSLQPTNPAQPPQLLVDTGPGGIDMSWWGGSPRTAHGARRGRAN